jgi:hypothetical protein
MSFYASESGSLAPREDTLIEHKNKCQGVGLELRERKQRRTHVLHIDELQRSKL